MFDFTDFIKEIVKDPAPGERFDPPLGFFLFDKRMLQPLAWHVGAVKGETGEVVTVETLQQMADSGLIPLLEGPWLGFEAAELRDVAEREEFYIDEFLTSDEWRYEDNDLNLLVRYAESEIQRHKAAPQFRPLRSRGSRV